MFNYHIDVVYVRHFVFLLFYVSAVALFLFLCFKQKTAYEMRTSDWSSDVCSSDLGDRDAADAVGPDFARVRGDLIAVGGVGGGEGEHGLFLRAHLVDRGADFGERHLPAAEEAVEVEHDRDRKSTRLNSSH